MPCAAVGGFNLLPDIVVTRLKSSLGVVLRAFVFQETCQEFIWEERNSRLILGARSEKEKDTGPYFFIIRQWIYLE